MYVVRISLPQFSKPPIPVLIFLYAQAQNLSVSDDIQKQSYCSASALQAVLHLEFRAEDRRKNMAGNPHTLRDQKHIYEWPTYVSIIKHDSL